MNSKIIYKAWANFFQIFTIRTSVLLAQDFPKLKQNILRIFQQTNGACSASWWHHHENYDAIFLMTKGVLYQVYI